MRRMLVTVAATATLMLTACAGTALAAGQPLCIGGPTKAVLTPDASGACKNGYTPVTLATQDEVTALQGEVTTLQSQNSTLTSEVSALQTTLSKVSYDATGLNGQPTLTITGANLQIANGSGATFGTANGTGNLILGYDENPLGFDQTGSHNLVLGNEHTFTSDGGLIAGQRNVLSGPASAVFGALNTASGAGSAVLGGLDNTASGGDSSVLGGSRNIAGGSCQSIPATNTC
jgi:hypothetical protein